MVSGYGEGTKPNNQIIIHECSLDVDQVQQVQMEQFKAVTQAKSDAVTPYVILESAKGQGTQQAKVAEVYFCLLQTRSIARV